MEIFFDYTCPFAYRAHRWLDPITEEINADWRPFSLLEHNYRGDGPSVWDLDERRHDISLLRFAGHSLVNAHRGDIDEYRRMLFSAWHDGHGNLSKSDVVRIVKLGSIPEPDSASDLLAEVRQLAGRAEILEVHRTVSATVDPLN